MASYRYYVTIQEPATSRCAMGSECTHPDCRQLEPIRRTFDGARAHGGHIPSACAIEWARSQHKRPDGTSITITRQPVGVGKVTGTVYTLGNAMPYRRYEVQGGIVRRTDR